MSIQSEMRDRGSAAVIAVIKSGDTAGAGLATRTNAKAFEKHFSHSELSVESALLAASAGTSTARRQRPAPMRYFRNLGLMLGTVDSKGLAGLRASPGIDKVLLAPQFRLIRPVLNDGTVSILRAPAMSWGIKRLKADKLWALGFTGEGVRVAHLDTGVDASHPALKGALHAYAEFDAFGDQVPDALPKDTDSHGTHTAGTIAGRKIRGKQFGMAPGSTLAVATVIEGGNTVARVLGGLEWALENGVRVLSMSLGLIGHRDDFRPVIQALRANGVLPVIAIGNEGPGTSRYPGNYAESLSVGASDRVDAIAGFSSSQRFRRARDPLVPDLVGPGVDVLSCVPGKKYAMSNGTSMATPHIAGLAALLFEAFPNATVDQMEAAIFSSCTLPSAISAERGNRGVPDAVKAHQWLSNNT